MHDLDRVDLVEIELSGSAALFISDKKCVEIDFVICPPKRHRQFIIPKTDIAIHCDAVIEGLNYHAFYFVVERVHFHSPRGKTRQVRILSWHGGRKLVIEWLCSPAQLHAQEEESRDI